MEHMCKLVCKIGVCTMSFLSPPIRLSCPASPKIIIPTNFHFSPEHQTLLSPLNIILVSPLPLLLISLPSDKLWALTSPSLNSEWTAICFMSEATKVLIRPYFWNEQSNPLFLENNGITKITEHFPCARGPVKHSAYIHSFTPHSISMRSVLLILLLSPIYIWGNWGRDRVTQIVSGGIDW